MDFVSVNDIITDNMNHKDWIVIYIDTDGCRLKDDNDIEVSLSWKTINSGMNCGEFTLKKSSKSTDDIKPNYYNFRTKHCSNIQKDFLSRNGMIAFYEGNILKYLYRYPQKNNIEDLKKARTYLNMLIELIIDEGI